MAFLSLKDIHKSYYLGKEEFPVLKGIDLDFDLGDFVSILGESGGGKSTLMNIIGGLDREFDGSVTVDGQVLDHKKEKALDSYRRETVGYIYQAYNLIAHLSVLDNVLISLDMTTLSRIERRTRAKELLTKVGLSDQINKYPNQLSGGQKQRVAIARALASDPEIIIADEPTGALDSQNTKEVLDILNQIAAEGRLVITVTHSQAVADTGTRIVNLVDGQIADDKRIKPAYKPETQPERLHSRLLPALVSYKTAYKHFKYNFWRNFLIVIGTAIGLFAVILFSGLGNGISGYIDKQITDLVNPQVVQVARYVKSDGPAGASGGPQAQAGPTAATVDLPTFSDSQIDKIENVKHVDKVEKTLTATGVTVKLGDKKATIASLPNWTEASTQSSITEGKAPKKGEVLLDKKTVAKVLAKKDWKSLIGKTVDLSYKTQDKDGNAVDVAFSAKVSGIGESSNNVSPISAINTETLTDQMASHNISTKPMAIAVKVDKLDNVTDVSNNINKLKINKKRVFNAIAVSTIIDTVQTYVNLASTILATIAGISLIVSALMIIVTMYMSVSARTKEIGILRALGESKRDIRRLFISESLIIGVLSAALATVIAYLIGFAANSGLQSIADYSFIQITFGDVLSAFITALVISLLAALLPARHAAKLNPIDALSAD